MAEQTGSDLGNFLHCGWGWDATAHFALDQSTSVTLAEGTGMAARRTGVEVPTPIFMISKYQEHTIRLITFR